MRGVCVINYFLDFLLRLVLFVQEMLPTVVVVISWMETVIDDTTRLFPALTPSTPAGGGLAVVISVFFPRVGMLVGMAGPLATMVVTVML
jgi:hypothetical protein